MGRPMRVVLATGLLTLLLAGPAAAHTGLTPGRIAPGETETAQLLVVHGCGEDGIVPGGDDPTFATTGVTLEVPDGVQVVAHGSEGWTLSTEDDDSGEVVRARWDHDDPAGELDTIRFDLDITAPDLPDGTEVWLPVIQDCTEGEQLAWTYPGIDEETGQYPATMLTVGADPATAADSGGLPTSIVITLALAIAVVAGAGVYLVTGRRG